MARRPNGIIVAVDGPSGAGKSTIARLLAELLGYIQIDTGAMYRAAAFSLSRAGIDYDDSDAVECFCRSLHITLAKSSNRQVVYANGCDVTDDIRTPEMSLLTSRTSALKPVREAMLKAQQQLGNKGGVVLEGRDIGTIVFPDAEMKFYLTASVEVRARRRYDELTEKGLCISLDETIADVAKRDRQDSERDIAPLKQADDAILVDSSCMSIDEVVTWMVTLCRARIDAMEDSQ